MSDWRESLWLALNIIGACIVVAIVGAAFVMGLDWIIGRLL